MVLKIKDFIEQCKATLLIGNVELECNSFSKDTRTIQENDIYIGIKGENFDGNKFYSDAFDKGALACILNEEYKNNIDLEKYKDKTIILVKNTEECLKQIAEFKMSNLNAKVIAITGSAGKTSTKEMIYSIINKKYKTFKTEANFNNLIGLPLSVLKIQDEEVIILEMGMNHLGEIKQLSNIAKPDLAVITNVTSAHIGEVGSIENIFQAKLEIISGLKPNGILIINNDNEYLNNLKLNNINIITCGINNQSDLMATNIIFDSKANFKVNNNEFELDIPTKNFILNSLLAIAVGLKLDIPIELIQKGIKSSKLTSGRLETINLNNNITLINDAYNANLDSMKNALDYLVNQNGDRKIAILGDMFELGDYSKNIHRQVGAYVASKNIDFLIAIGIEAKHIFEETMNKGMSPNKIKYFADKEKCYEFLKKLIQPNDTIIVKASNGMKFIEIVEQIQSI